VSTNRRRIFGGNVRRLRSAKGMSQEKFAFARDMHRNYIGSIERGERNVSIDSMQRIATTLGVDLTELVGIAKEASP
jgi:transcriptional regulator with XRE-family HTH domain